MKPVFILCLLTLVSADYQHRHEHAIQMKYHEHPRFGNNSIRFCAFNQYLDDHEGRCMIIPGGGTAISIDDDTTCDVETLRPHPAAPSTYYACRRTKTILAECRSGQRFENRLKRCAIDVASGDSTSDDAPETYDHIALPACEGPGRFPVPSGNCTLFYACTSNGFRLFRTIYQCPPSTGFDPTAKMCSPDFACDRVGEPNPEFSTVKPEPNPEFSTVKPEPNPEFSTVKPEPNPEFSTVKPEPKLEIGDFTTTTIGPQATSPVVISSTLDSTESSTTEMIPTSSEYNETSASTPSPLNLSTEAESVNTTDDIVGARQFSTLPATQNDSTTNDANIRYSTPSYSPQETSNTEMIFTTRKWLYDFSTTENSAVEAISTPSPMNLSTEAESVKTTDDIVGAREFSTIPATQEDSTTNDANIRFSTPSYSSQETSNTEIIPTTRKWLFDFPTTEDSTMAASESTSSTLLTTAEIGVSTESSVTEATDVGMETSVAPTEASTISDELLSSQSATTVAFEPTTEDSAVGDINLTTTQETLFDSSSTEKSYLGSTEAASTNVPIIMDSSTTQDASSSTVSTLESESASASSEKSSGGSVTTTEKFNDEASNDSKSDVETTTSLSESTAESTTLSSEVTDVSINTESVTPATIAAFSTTETE